MPTAISPMAVLSLAAQRDKSKLASGDAWILLVDLIWSGTHIRLARNVDAIQFDCGDGNGIQTYQAFNFEFTSEQPGQGQLPTMTLRASNTMRVLQGIIEQYSGIAGAKANIYVYNTAHPDGEPDLAVETTVMKTVCTASLVTLTLSAPSPMRKIFPRFLYRASFCMWVSNYKGDQCAYSGTAISAATNATAAILTTTGLGAVGPVGTTFSAVISGFTGNWAAANGAQTVTLVTEASPATFSIPVDSTDFGAMTGSPILTLDNCDGTYASTCGCQVHDNAARYGAFPGIGTNGTALASQA
jgi:phage-related protein